MNNVSNINETSNSVKSMPLIAHSGAPVITTDMLADVYGTEVINIQVNHSRNKNRFIEGKHFYKLTGSILKEFKNWLTKSKLVYKGSEIISKHAKSIILWTERGAARHAKMLDTDNAWDVFEALEDFYFAKKEDAFHKTTTDDRAPLRNAVDCLMTKKRLSFPKAYGYVHAKYGVNSIDEVPLDLLPEAVDYIYKVALEGEYIPKQQSPQVGLKSLAMPMSFFDEYSYLFDLVGIDKKEAISRFDKYPQEMLKNMAEYPNPLGKMLTKLSDAGVNVDAAWLHLRALKHNYEVNTRKLNSSMSDGELSRLLVVRNRFDKALSLWKDNLCRNLIRMDVPSAVPFNQAVTDAISELRFITDKISERLIA
ncbi:ORF6N domain-containing protein [Providencia rettgeri]|uniref:ORF6N domain-containing protein n=1 Tax=Providencia sp. PROV158 TaxID=2949868 RepID=UPI0023492DE4|nr:ORF6N domain-containing protein [Providencia sp. PROV158]